MNTSTPNGPLAEFLKNPRAQAIDQHEAWHWVTIGIRVLIPVLAVLMLLVFLRQRAQQQRVRKERLGARCFKVALPPVVESSAGDVFWTNLHDLLRPSWKRFWEGQPHISFELVWQGVSLSFQLWVPSTYPTSVITHAVEAAWPGAAVEVIDGGDCIAANSVAIGGELRTNGPEWHSLNVDHDIDPLRTVIAAVGELRETQGAVVQVLARPVTGRRMGRCYKAAIALRNDRSPSRVIRFLDAFSSGHRSARSSDDPNRNADVRAALAKAMSLGWESRIRYCVCESGGDSPAVKAALKARAHGLASAFALYSGRTRLIRRSVRSIASSLNQRTLGKGDLYTVAELAAIAHLPTDEVVPGVLRAGARSVSPVPAVPSTGKVFGDAQSGVKRATAVAADDGRYHFHVLGSTGSGKSTLLTNLVLQDVAARRGAVVIDPKGDLIVDILDRLPQDAAGRVVLIDPQETGQQATMNILGSKDDDADLVVDNLIGIFSRIFGAYWGPRTDDVLRSACLTLMKRPPATLADVPRILSDAKFRAPFKERIGIASELKGFWDWYEAMSDAQQAQVIGPVMNKLRAFLLRPFVTDIVGATESSFSMENVLDGGLMLVRIPKGIVGDETARLMGSFVVAKVWQAATARSNSGQHARLNACLYVDECQNFLNLPRSFDEMLAESRGYGLSLVLAHQHLGQLSRELRDAISSNARNKVFFSMSPEDAHTLERHFKPELTAHDLSHLGAYQLALRAVANGREQPACTITTRAASPVIEGRADAIRRRVRAATTEARRSTQKSERQSTGRKVGSRVGIGSSNRVGPGLGSPGTAEADECKTAGEAAEGLAAENPDLVGE